MAWTWFDRIIFIVILINAVILAIETPNVKNNSMILIGLEGFLMTFYTVELVIKVFAQGFVCGKYSYLRDPWNMVDFVILSISYTAVFNIKMRYQSIRIFRVLRTLRTITVMPSMAGLVKTLINLVPAMGNMSILFALTILLFATIAMQLFAGDLSGRCVPLDKINCNITIE